MDETHEGLIATINRAADRMREAGLPAALVERMQRLAGKVDEPCTVAVVGRVKVGKSTFVNALLGRDLAKVGTTETTATINYFKFGEPDPEKPVECHYRNGQVAKKSKEFLDGLQGNDPATLERASGIHHLEYSLLDSLLRRITLVDTPGTGAVVEEHQERAEEFALRKNKKLRERHDEETRELNDKADAVIYLLDAVAKSRDQDFLDEFAETTGGRSSALNAVGVISKIELEPEIEMEEWHERSAKVASQLKESLNTVIPVAAGARRELDRLLEDGDRAGLERLMGALRRIEHPGMLDFLLDDYGFFTEDEEYEGEPVPVSRAEREELARDFEEWGVFKTIARVAADPDLDLEGVVKQLEKVTGFKTLREILEKHFVERGHILRRYRIVRDALEVLDDIRYDELPRRKKEAKRERERLERFVSIIRRADADMATKSDFEEFVSRHLNVKAREDELKELHADLKEGFDGIHQQLRQDNADFEALRRLEEPDHGFSQAERDELRPLLGLHGRKVEERLPPGKETDADHVMERMLEWGVKKERAPFGSARQVVAERAYTRYGMVYEELEDAAKSAAARQAVRAAAGRTSAEGTEERN